MNSHIFTVVQGSEDWANRLNILSFIAGSSNTPSSLLNEVYAEAKATHPVSVLLEKLALNPNADISLLQLLADDASPIVRAAVAKNPKSIALMWKLAKDESAYVRFELAAANHFPEHLYETLARDREARIASRAKRTLRSIKYSQSVVGSIAGVVGGFWSHREAS